MHNSQSDENLRLVPADPNASVEGVSALWDDQEGKTFDFDFSMYNTKLWMVLKITFCIAILTLTYILYALHELPWTIFGMGIGLVIFGVLPFFAGLILGFSFDNMKKALAIGIIVGFISMLLAHIIFRLPYSLGYAEYDGEFMLEVWFYLFIWLINMISFVPAGIAVGTSSNMYE